MATKPASASVVEKDGRDNQDPNGVWLVREKLTSSIKEKLSKLPPTPTGYCIYKVPERLKANNKDAFTPYVVSIGPFHHQDPRLKAMEDYKLRWLREFFKEHNSNVFATVDFVVRNEATIRQHYEDLGEISSEEFCEMILLDSIFILGLLLGKEIEKELTEFDILHDMLLIENQLPLFVPCKIYILSVGTEEGFNNLVYQYFFRHLDRHNTTNNTSSKEPTQKHGGSDVTQLSQSIQSEAAHFIEYLRMSYFDVKQQKPNPPAQPASKVCCSCFSCSCNFSKNMEQLESGPDGSQRGQSRSLCSWFPFSVKLENLCSCFFSSSKSPRSAKELSEAGVTFSPTIGKRLNNIKFDDGKLEIPPIKVNELTETLFRNLMAFEQCKRLPTKDVCDYIIFMDSLIDTPEDVDILRRKEIIKNSPDDSEKISNLFNNLYRENISERKSVHDDILEDLKKYNKDPWHQWKAKWYKWKQMLKNEYFKSPWTVISLIAGTILLILTAIQTACSIIGL